MRILFIQIPGYTKASDKGIYPDLIRYFKNKKHEIYVVTSFERNSQKPTTYYEDNGIHILGVKTLNITKAGTIEKGIGYLTAEGQYKRAIKKYLRDTQIDLVIYSTGCFLMSSPVEYIKNRDGAMTYLLLKDIFPQNAVDLGMFSKNSIFNKYFSYRERKSYEAADYIGCMSPRNVEFLLENNAWIDKDRVEVCPNSVEIDGKLKTLNSEEKCEIRRKYGIPKDKMVIIYGGNLGAPQGIPFLIKAIDAARVNDKAFFLVVGSGTYYKAFETFIKNNNPDNIKLLKALPQNEYNNIVKACDVGLICLDYRFTIPNYPSRLLAYLQNAMPVLACTDMSCDTGTIAEKNGYGYFTPSNSTEGFVKTVQKFTDHPETLKAMGMKGYEFLKKNYLVEQSYNIIMKHFQNK